MRGEQRPGISLLWWPQSPQSCRSPGSPDPRASQKTQAEEDGGEGGQQGARLVVEAGGLGVAICGPAGALQLVQGDGLLLRTLCVIAHLGTDTGWAACRPAYQEAWVRAAALLTCSTASKTLSRLSARAPLTSASVHCLLSSSATRSGYLDTSSSPKGSLRRGQREPGYAFRGSGPQGPVHLPTNHWVAHTPIPRHWGSSGVALRV